MSGFAQFQIPVAPHIKKYLISNFGENYVVAETDFLGMLLIPYFSKEIKRNELQDLTDSVKSDFYTISVSYKFFVRQGFFLSHGQLKIIGRILDKYFREVLFNHVAVYSHNHPKKQKQCIVDFCKLNGITVEDIDPDTLYRDYYRKKSSRMSVLVEN